MCISHVGSVRFKVPTALAPRLFNAEIVAGGLRGRHCYCSIESFQVLTLRNVLGDFSALCSVLVSHLSLFVAFPLFFKEGKELTGAPCYSQC